MPTIERRTVPRFNLRVPVGFRPISNQKIPLVTAETLNISQRGALIATDYPLGVGTPVEMFLRMPREVTGKAPTELRCTGRVVHVLSDPAFKGKRGVGVIIDQYEPLTSAERWAS